MTIFAIGDSHCIFYYDSLIIKTHWVGWGGMPVTIFRLIEDGLPLYTIADKLPPGDTCKINIKDGDYVLFSYGWNDVQKNIYKYSKDNYEVEINRMVIKYINLIKQYSDGTLYRIKPIINCVYPIPLSMNDTILGSDNDRILYTKYINERLKVQCNIEGIPFFDIYNIIAKDDKINSNLTDIDLTHLDRKNTDLCSLVESKLINICENYDSVRYSS
jgi:hypothetical protein